MTSKNLSALIFLSFFTGFSWANGDIMELEKACEKGSGLDCSKAAYKYRKAGDLAQAQKFYEKGCGLKEESACYNLQNASPRELYLRKIQAQMSFHSKNITNCHIPNLANKTSVTQLTEKWHKADINMHITKSGKVDHITVQTDLSENFVNCTRKIIKTIQFPAPDSEITYHYNLTFTSHE